MDKGLVEQGLITRCNNNNKMKAEIKQLMETF